MKVNKPQPKRPKINHINLLETEALFQIVNKDSTTDAKTQCLVEILRRISQTIAERDEKIKYLETKLAELKLTINPPKKKCGRKKTVYTFNGRELDDDELLRLIDGEYISISKLEKETGANKNVLRRRYERLKVKGE